MFNSYCKLFLILSRKPLNHIDFVIYNKFQLNVEVENFRLLNIIIQ